MTSFSIINANDSLIANIPKNRWCITLETRRTKIQQFFIYLLAKTLQHINKKVKL